MFGSGSGDVGGIGHREHRERSQAERVTGLGCQAGRGSSKPACSPASKTSTPQRSYYVPEWQYEWLTARPLLNFAHAIGGRGYRLLNEGAQSYNRLEGRTYVHLPTFDTG